MRGRFVADVTMPASVARRAPSGEPGLDRAQLRLEPLGELERDRRSDRVDAGVVVPVQPKRGSAELLERAMPLRAQVVERGPQVVELVAGDDELGRRWQRRE